MYVPDELDTALSQNAVIVGQWPMPPETVVQRLADSLRQEFGKPACVEVTENGYPWVEWVMRAAGCRITVWVCSTAGGVLQVRKL